MTHIVAIAIAKFVAIIIVLVIVQVIFALIYPGDAVAQIRGMAAGALSLTLYNWTFK